MLQNTHKGRTQPSRTPQDHMKMWHHCSIKNTIFNSGRSQLQHENVNFFTRYLYHTELQNQKELFLLRLVTILNWWWWWWWWIFLVQGWIRQRNTIPCTNMYGVLKVVSNAHFPSISHQISWAADQGKAYTHSITGGYPANWISNPAPPTCMVDA